MKLVRTANGKQTIKMSKNEWTSIGKKAGLVKKAIFIKECDFQDTAPKSKESIDESIIDKIINCLSNTNNSQVTCLNNLFGIKDYKNLMELHKILNNKKYQVGVLKSSIKSGSQIIEKLQAALDMAIKYEEEHPSEYFSSEYLEEIRNKLRGYFSLYESDKEPRLKSLFYSYKNLVTPIRVSFGYKECEEKIQKILEKSNAPNDPFVNNKAYFLYQLNGFKSLQELLRKALSIDGSHAGSQIKQIISLMKYEEKRFINIIKKYHNFFSEKDIENIRVIFSEYFSNLDYYISILVDSNGEKLSREDILKALEDEIRKQNKVTFNSYKFLLEEFINEKKEKLSNQKKEIAIIEKEIQDSLSEDFMHYLLINYIGNIIQTFDDIDISGSNNISSQWKHQYEHAKKDRLNLRAFFPYYDSLVERAFEVSKSMRNKFISENQDEIYQEIEENAHLPVDWWLWERPNDSVQDGYDNEKEFMRDYKYNPVSGGWFANTTSGGFSQQQDRKPNTSNDDISLEYLVGQYRDLLDKTSISYEEVMSSIRNKKYTKVFKLLSKAFHPDSHVKGTDKDREKAEKAFKDMMNLISNFPKEASNLFDLFKFN